MYAIKRKPYIFIEMNEIGLRTFEWFSNVATYAFPGDVFFLSRSLANVCRC